MSSGPDNYRGLEEIKNPDTFIDGIFQSTNCMFSPEQKILVRIAYEFACEIHERQERANWEPYIIHIQRSVQKYIYETVGGIQSVDPSNLIKLILHDTIEDCKPDRWDLIIKMYDRLGDRIWLDILRMSEPSENVREVMRYIGEKRKDIYQEVINLEYNEVYAIVEKKKFDSFLTRYSELKKPLPDLSSLLHQNLVQYGTNIMLPKWTQEVDVNGKMKIFWDFIFLAIIASLPADLFLVKATERRDNLQDYVGLIRNGRIESAQRTVTTTELIYIPRARELWMRLREKETKWMHDISLESMLSNMIVWLTQDIVRIKEAFAQKGTPLR